MLITTNKIMVSTMLRNLIVGWLLALHQVEVLQVHGLPSAGHPPRFCNEQDLLIFNKSPHSEPIQIVIDINVDNHSRKIYAENNLVRKKRPDIDW